MGGRLETSNVSLTGIGLHVKKRDDPRLEMMPLHSLSRQKA